ncbi:hypothetical protein NUU61_008752 [Penicillium alfredii]|uniref:Uncharacterized protein n=1 Tax=Penicillium alfredii TaxID=1506179 RepID=A0A9W9ELP8_9EURO|nr:uncharacterized protein NUU61_008752 [Penicillium alfredii]KAJ5084173.1 hypothetical protein NUU61_008752 [Penicillium alfredii]
MRIPQGVLLLAVTAMSMADSIPNFNATGLQKRMEESPGCAEPDKDGHRFRWAACTAEVGSESGTPMTTGWDEGEDWCWLSSDETTRQSCSDGDAGTLESGDKCLGYSVWPHKKLQYKHGGCPPGGQHQ